MTADATALPDRDAWLVADDLTWKVVSPAGDLIVCGFEELDMQAVERDGTVMAFSYQPSMIEDEPPQPRQYRLIKIERLPGT